MALRLRCSQCNNPSLEPKMCFVCCEDFAPCCCLQLTLSVMHLIQASFALACPGSKPHWKAEKVGSSTLRKPFVEHLVEQEAYAKFRKSHTSLRDARDPTCTAILGCRPARSSFPSSGARSRSWAVLHGATREDTLAHVRLGDSQQII